MYRNQSFDLQWKSFDWFLYDVIIIALKSVNLAKRDFLLSKKLMGEHFRKIIETAVQIISGTIVFLGYIATSK